MLKTYMEPGTHFAAELIAALPLAGRIARAEVAATSGLRATSKELTPGNLQLCSNGEALSH
jgi:hypothetical protein